MTTFQYHVRTGENGSIVIPSTPFAAGETIKIIVEKELPDESVDEDDWHFDPRAIQEMFDERISCPDLTDEDIERFKHERRMRKML